jgi:hypothetical protein
MRTLQTLQWKISGTKKRLSESPIHESILWSLAFSGLLAVLTYSSRSVTLGGSWGLVELDIPVVSLPFNDVSKHNFREQPNTSIGVSTVVIAVTPRELIFGDVAAFTSQRMDVRNKFIVPHLDGSPQVAALFQQAAQWENDRKNRLGIRTDGIAILLPDPQVPVAVVAAVAERIKSSGRFSHVAIGGGLL